MTFQPSAWIIRVNDGENFRNSKLPFWGVKRGNGDCIKTIVKKMKYGDGLFFLTSKNHGGKIIGMAEYTHFLDRLEDETVTNENQNWEGEDVWDIQIHYKDLYITEKQDIKACIQCGGVILFYDTFKNRIEEDLIGHHQNFKFYANPKLF